MKKLLVALTLFSSLLLFTGCPYESEVPIDTPAIKVNEKLLGKWELRTNSDDVFTVSKLDGFTYKIVKQTKGSEDKSNYAAFMSDVAGTKYLNINEITELSTKTYYLYKFEQVSDGLVTFFAVTANVDEKFTSSADLKNFIAKNQGHSFFFDSAEDSYIKTGN